MILAVDGGGSTCRVALEHAGSRHVVSLGAANVTSDFDGAVARITEGLQAVAQAAGLSPEALRACPAYLGLAGVTGPALADTVARALPLDHAVVEEDRRAAVVGALGRVTGCVAGLGTGSFLARQDGDNFRSIGGYGLVLGDEASAAWLGRELLIYTLRAHDRIEAHTPVSKALLDDLGGAPGVIAFAASATPERFGQLAPRITQAPDDPAAALQMRRGTAYVATGLNALGWRPEEPICLIGGVAGAYADWLPKEMAEALRPAEGSALDGALALARRLAPVA